MLVKQCAFSTAAALRLRKPAAQQSCSNDGLTLSRSLRFFFLNADSSSEILSSPGKALPTHVGMRLVKRFRFPWIYIHADPHKFVLERLQPLEPLKPKPAEDHDGGDD